MQFNNAVGDLSNDEVDVRRELGLFWNKFGCGTFKYTRRCPNCNDESEQHPEFTELIVPANHYDAKVTLEQLILEDSTDRNDDSNVFRCEICDVAARPIKTSRIERHPEVLCILVQRISFDAETQTQTRHNTRVAFPIVNFNPNDSREGIEEGQTYDLFSGIYHKTTGSNTGHFTVVCSDDNNRNNWITYDDMEFETNAFLNKKITVPTAKVIFHKEAYMLFYKRNGNASLSSNRESIRGGREDDDNSDTDERFSLDGRNEEIGHNVDNQNGFDVSSHSVEENTNGENNHNHASSVPMNNIDNPTESSGSNQSAEENANGHIDENPSTSVVTTNDIQPLICPTQQNNVKQQVSFINLTNDTDSEDEDDEEDEADEADEQYPTCQMCWNKITSDRDVGYINTGGKCNCNDLKYHTFCLRRYRNDSDKKKRKECSLHGNKIREFWNIDDQDTCMICQYSLDTKSVWGRFVCHTCPRPNWYHYACLLTYLTNEGSYHMDRYTKRYDMNRLKCIICRESPRSIEKL